MSRMYVICSNPECNFSKSFGMRSDNPTGNYCVMCGQKYIFNCPHCDALVAAKGAKFCEGCAKPLKDEPAESAE